MKKKSVVISFNGQKRNIQRRLLASGEALPQISTLLIEKLASWQYEPCPPFLVGKTVRLAPEQLVKARSDVIHTLGPLTHIYMSRDVWQSVVEADEWNGLIDYATPSLLGDGFVGSLFGAAVVSDAFFPVAIRNMWAGVCRLYSEPGLTEKS